MSRVRAISPFLAPDVAAGLLFAGCGDDDNSSDTTVASTTVADPAVTDDSPAPTEPSDETTVADSTEPVTTVAAAWDGDAEAAIATIEGHLTGVHAGAAYMTAFQGVAIDPATGLATIETSLLADQTADALTACTDAAMVAWSTDITGLDVIDGAGNVLAAGTAETTCANP